LYDWNDCRIVRRIDVTPKSLYWNDSGELLAITTENSFFILKYNPEAVRVAYETGTAVDEQGVESAFDVLNEISERVRTAIWVGDVFIYVNVQSRLNYCVGGEVFTIAHLDRTMYLLGYIPRDNHVYLIDKASNIVHHTVLQSVLEYQTAVMRGDTEAAKELLPTIPKEYANRIARFLDSQGLKELALQTAQDPELKFEFALQQGKIDMVFELAKEIDSDQRWKQLADLAMTLFKFDMAEQCLLKAKDYSGLLLLYSSTGNVNGVTKLAVDSAAEGLNNIAFICFFLLGKVEDCLELLCNTGRVPEAAFFARTYLPSQTSRIVKLWRENLKLVNERAAEALADPTEYENLFPDLKWALQAEELFHSKRKELLPAAKYSDVKDEILRDVIKEIKKSKGIEEVIPPKPASFERMPLDIMVQPTKEDAQAEDDDDFSFGSEAKQKAKEEKKSKKDQKSKKK